LGHEKGSFNAATTQAKRGFEQANGGTLFLDEVGDIPLSIAGQSCARMQERRFERVGGRTAPKWTSHHWSDRTGPCQRLVKEGKVSEDLSIA